MRFLNLHTHKTANDPNVVEIVNQFPSEFDKTIPYYSMGIHPWYISKSTLGADLQILESRLADDNCLALGECGLDKRIEIPLALQQQVFESQLALVQHYKKPVIVHCVAAFSEVIAIKKRLQISNPMIIHGFSKNKEAAKQLLDNGFYLSFGKYLLRNPELESAFQLVPNERFFLETDTIEEGIREVYALAAKYKNSSLDELGQNIAGNFKTVFNKIL